MDMDIGLKLLQGVPIDIGIGKIHPLKLSEISEIGEPQYNQYLSVINLDPAQFEIEDENVKSFQLVTMFCALDQAYRTNVLKALSLFFKEDVKFHESGIFFIDDFRIIDEEKFDLVRDVIKKQNFIGDKKEEFDGKVSDDPETQRIMEMRKKIKQEIKKRNKEKGLRLEDVISIVASHVPNINFINIWDLTVYQLYTMYSRLMMKENYESNFAIYLQSGDPNSLDLKHWARELDF